MSQDIPYLFVLKLHDHHTNNHQSKFMKSIICSVSFLFAFTSILFAQKPTAQRVAFWGSDKPIYFQHVASKEELVKIEHKHERFLQQNLGHFSNKSAAAQIEGEREAQFIVIPIFQKQRAGEFWIYIEYFLPAMVEQPIEQRIQHYIRNDRYSYQIKTYHLKNPEQYVNEWKKKNPFEGFNVKDGLTHDEFCDMQVLVDEEKEHYHKATPLGTDCPLRDDMGAAKYSVTSFDVSDDGYLMCIEFLDANKQKIKNCPNGGILFERLDYNDKDYRPLAPSVAELNKTAKSDSTPDPVKPTDKGNKKGGKGKKEKKDKKTEEKGS